VGLRAGYDVLVARHGGHQLRVLKLSTGEVDAGRGSMPAVRRPWTITRTTRWPSTSPRRGTGPVDDKVIIAMAGIHQFWWFESDQAHGRVPYAAPRVESLRDLPVPYVWMHESAIVPQHASGSWGRRPNPLTIERRWPPLGTNPPIRTVPLRPFTTLSDFLLFSSHSPGGLMNARQRNFWGLVSRCRCCRRQQNSNLACRMNIRQAEDRFQSALRRKEFAQFELIVKEFARPPLPTKFGGRQD